MSKKVFHRIKRIREEVFKDCKRIEEEVLEKHVTDLACGKWSILWIGKYVIVLNDTLAKSFYIRKCIEYTKRYGMVGLVRVFVKSVFCNTHFVVSNNKDGFDANAMLVGFYGEYLLFNLKRQLVKRTDTTLFQKYQTLFSAGFFSYFCTPAIFEKGILLEKQIVYRLKLDYRDVFSQLVNLYYLYTGNTPVQHWCSLNRIIDSMKGKGYQIDKLYVDCKIPYYYLHGDCHEENVLVGKNGMIYMIDYEHMGMYPFFYDLFIYAIFRLVSHNDGRLINELLCGNVREKDKIILERWFERFDIPLDESHLKCFIKLSFAIYIDRCVIKVDEESVKTKWMELYEKVANRMVHIYESNEL